MRFTPKGHTLFAHHAAFECSASLAIAYEGGVNDNDHVRGCYAPTGTASTGRARRTMQATGEAPLCKKSLSTFLTSSCALGLLWNWYILAGNAGPKVFGMETPFSDSFRLVSALAPMVVLLALGSKQLNIRLPHRIQVLIGTIGGVAGTLMLWSLHMLDPGNQPLFVTLALLSGASYAILLHAWMRKNLTKDFFALLLHVTCASVIMMLIYIALQLLPSPAIIWCAIVIIVTTGALLIGSPARADEVREPNLSAGRPKRNDTLLASLILGSFANGLLLASWVPKDAVSWVFAVVPLGLVIWLIAIVQRKRVTPYSGLASLSTFVCASIVAAVFLPASTPLLSSLIFAGFWLLLAFAAAASTWIGATSERNASRIAARCMGCVISAHFLSRLVGTFVEMQDMAFLTIAAVLLAFSLALALVASNAAPTSTDRSGEVSSEINDLCGKIAALKDLTERERDVFCLLAKGYSLKSIAEKLFVSENTVKSHRRRIYLKLDVNSRQELIDLVEASRSQSDLPL